MGGRICILHVLSAAKNKLSFTPKSYNVLRVTSCCSKTDVMEETVHCKVFTDSSLGVTFPQLTLTKKKRRKKTLNRSPHPSPSMTSVSLQNGRELATPALSRYVRIIAARCLLCAACVPTGLAGL